MKTFPLSTSSVNELLHEAALSKRSAILKGQDYGIQFLQRVGCLACGNLIISTLIRSVGSALVTARRPIALSSTRRFPAATCLVCQRNGTPTAPARRERGALSPCVGQHYPIEITTENREGINTPKDTSRLCSTQLAATSPDSPNEAFT